MYLVYLLYSVSGIHLLKTTGPPTHSVGRLLVMLSGVCRRRRL